MKCIGIILSVIAALSIAACAGYAEQTRRTATIVSCEGTCEVKTADHDWTRASEGMVLNQGDILRTRQGSRVEVNLDGNGETASAELSENSQVTLADLTADAAEETQSTLLDLAMGNILIKARKLHSEKSQFKVKTPTSIVGVKGTTFSVSVEAIE